MAIKRGPDGIPMDVPSVIYKRDSNEAKTQAPSPGASPEISVNLDNQPTVKGSGPSPSSTAPTKLPNESLFLDDPPTAPAARQNQAPQGLRSSAVSAPIVAALDETKTSIAGGHKQAQGKATSFTEVDAMANPLAGWLVIIDGPGKGNFLKIGYGQNTVGRGNGERICLDFGDSLISRSGHAIVTYDPRGRRFYLQPGSGPNLSYLNDAPILQATELPAFSHIIMGETTLRFVPFCGQDFFWDKSNQGESCL